MKGQSRRHFNHQCLKLALAGGLGTLSSQAGGCKDSEKAELDMMKTGQDRKHSTMNGTTKNIGADFEPSYLKLHQSGELKKRGDALWEMMKNCELCPRTCGINRIEGNRGFCRAGSQLEISSYNPHFGEEKPLVGREGSGTIFLTHCGLRCVFCINWEVSHEGIGTLRSIEDLARIMMHIQGIGCHNINVVTPTHYSAHIILALDIAAGKGLRLPLVYNTCGWERLEIVKMLDGIVDIYLPDYKYSDGTMASKFSADAKTYPEVTQQALIEMNRQVGTANPSGDGIMYRGLMIRHLVMPNNVSGTKKVIEWIVKNLPKDTYLNIMSQYRPMYRASEFKEIARKISRKEYSNAVKWAQEAGLTNLEIQGWPRWGL